MLHTHLQFILLIFRVSRTSPTTLIFGTLDITLPSTQENGEVSVGHGRLRKSFEISEISEYDCSYLSWVKMPSLI